MQGPWGPYCLHYDMNALFLSFFDCQLYFFGDLCLGLLNSNGTLFIWKKEE